MVAHSIGFVLSPSVLCLVYTVYICSCRKLLKIGIEDKQAVTANVLGSYNMCTVTSRMDDHPRQAEAKVVQS